MKTINVTLDRDDAAVITTALLILFAQEEILPGTRARIKELYKEIQEKAGEAFEDRI